MPTNEATAELRRLAAKCYRKAEHALSLHAGLRVGGGSREVLVRLDAAARAWHSAGELAEQAARALGRRGKVRA